MMYQSTRDPSHKKYTSAEVIKMGLAPDGGLFLPETIPTLSEADIEALRHESYPVRAARILHMFLTDYTQEELMPAAEKLAETIAKNAPIAVRACKKAINDGLQLEMDKAIVIEEELFGSCFQSADQIEGMSAFLEKRKHEPYQNK